MLDTHAHTHTEVLPPQAQFPRPLAPRGLSVSDAGDSRASGQGGLGLDQGF